MPEAKFYVYVHREADSGNVFYVGKGSGQRATATLQRPAFWHRVCDKHGLVVEIVAMFWLEADAFAHERALIAECREAGLRLTNCTDGGEGPSGAQRSEETRRKIGDAKRGSKRPPDTDETRARKRASALGRPMSPEAIAKTAASRVGTKLRPETVDKIKATLKGRLTRGPITEEEKQRIGAMNRGKSMTTVQLEALAEGRRKYWAARRATA